MKSAIIVLGILAANLVLADESFRLVEPERRVPSPDATERLIVQPVMEYEAYGTLACYDNSGDCKLRASYVCDPKQLTPEGHRGVKVWALSSDGVCSITCKDLTKATCTRSR